MMMSRQTPAPISDGSPYMPVITYTMAWPMVMIIPNTGSPQTELEKPRTPVEILPADKSLPTFLGSVKEGSVFWSVANFNDLSTSQELHYQA